MGADGREFQPGETVAGTRYVVDRPLAEGGHGACYIVRQGLGERRFAMKILHASHCENAEMSLRMLNEGKKLTAMEHPNIVTVFDVDQTGEPIPRPYYVMEYLRGGSLRTSLRSAAKEDLGVGMGVALDIVIELSDALDYAHTRHGVIHRDLKPENIFVVAAPNNQAITKLLDFGVMHMLAQTKRITQRAVAVGTPLYMAPEQLRGEVPVPQTDLFALGVVLYELLTGRTPYKRSSSLADLGPQILFSPPPSLYDATGRTYPPLIEDVVAHLLAKAAQDRPKSASWLASELRYIRTAVAKEYGEQPAQLLQTDRSPIQNMITMTRADSMRVTAQDRDAPTAPGAPNARRLVAEAETRSADATDPGMAEEPPVDGNTLEIASRALLGDTLESAVRADARDVSSSHDVDRTATTRSLPPDTPQKPSLWTAQLPIGAHYSPPLIVGDKSYVDVEGDAKSSTPRPSARRPYELNTSGAGAVAINRSSALHASRPSTRWKAGPFVPALVFVAVLVVGIGIVFTREVWLRERSARVVVAAKGTPAPLSAPSAEPTTIPTAAPSASAPIAAASESDSLLPEPVPTSELAPSTIASAEVAPPPRPSATALAQLPRKSPVDSKRVATPAPKPKSPAVDDEGFHLLMEKP